MTRLVICCDGTWNRPDQISPTNVTKLALAVAPTGSDGVAQSMYYHRGVGTTRSERLTGGAFGFGLSRNIRDCYRFIVERYAPGDELFIGHENEPPDMREVALVLAPYGRRDRAVGVVGVLGPTRLAYPEAIGTVRFVSGLMNELVDHLYN